MSNLTTFYKILIAKHWLVVRRDKYFRCWNAECVCHFIQKCSSGGSGIVLSRKAVQHLNVKCQCPRVDPTDHMADGHLGSCLDELNIRVVHSEGFHQVHNTHYPERTTWVDKANKRSGEKGSNFNSIKYHPYPYMVLYVAFTAKGAYYLLFCNWNGFLRDDVRQTDKINTYLDKPFKVYKPT